MPQIPKAITDLGAGVVVLFLIVLLFYVCLQIIKAIKSTFRAPQPAENVAGFPVNGRPQCAYLESNIIMRETIKRMEPKVNETYDVAKTNAALLARIATSTERQEKLLLILTENVVGKKIDLKKTEN